MQRQTFSKTRDALNELMLLKEIQRPNAPFSIKHDLDLLVLILSLPKFNRDPSMLKALDEGLSPIPFFAKKKQEIFPESFEQLLRHLNVEKLQRHQTVFNIGDPGNKFYVILKGACYVMLKKNGIELNESQCSSPRSPSIIRQRQKSIVLQLNGFGRNDKGAEKQQAMGLRIRKFSFIQEQFSPKSFQTQTRFPLSKFSCVDEGEMGSPGLKKNNGIGSPLNMDGNLGRFSLNQRSRSGSSSSSASEDSSDLVEFPQKFPDQELVEKHGLSKYISSTLKEGESFGEIALENKIPRTATIVAAENSILLSLNADDYLLVQKEFKAAGKQKKIDQLRLNVLFQDWTIQQLNQLLYQASNLAFPKGQGIIVQNQPVGALYFITQGEVELRVNVTVLKSGYFDQLKAKKFDLKGLIKEASLNTPEFSGPSSSRTLFSKSKSNEEHPLTVKLALLREGDCFGEESLLGLSAECSALAFSSDLTVLEFRRKKFQHSIHEYTLSIMEDLFYEKKERREAFLLENILVFCKKKFGKDVRDQYLPKEPILKEGFLPYLKGSKSIPSLLNEFQCKADPKRNKLENKMIHLPKEISLKMKVTLEINEMKNKGQNDIPDIGEIIKRNEESRKCFLNKKREPIKLECKKNLTKEHQSTKKSQGNLRSLNLLNIGRKANATQMSLSIHELVHSMKMQNFSSFCFKNDEPLLLERTLIGSTQSTERPQLKSFEQAILVEPKLPENQIVLSSLD